LDGATFGCPVRMTSQPKVSKNNMATLTEIFKIKITDITHQQFLKWYHSLIESTPCPDCTTKRSIQFLQNTIAGEYFVCNHPTKKFKKCNSGFTSSEMFLTMQGTPITNLEDILTAQER